MSNDKEKAGQPNAERPPDNFHGIAIFVVFKKIIGLSEKKLQEKAFKYFVFKTLKLLILHI